MNETYKLWKVGKVTDSQMALVFFIHRFAIDFEDQRLLELIKNEESSKILANYQFKKIKGKALTCLKKWVAGEWNLILSEKIFTPYEILAYQAKGIRPVTMMFKEFESPVLHRKNSLDFLVHDLEHGFMFFNDLNLKNMQQSFFVKIQNSLTTDLWTEKLKDKAFKEKFFYMISDMNSHQEHYKAYLKSIILRDEYSKFEFLFD